MYRIKYNNTLKWCNEFLLTLLDEVNGENHPETCVALHIGINNNASTMTDGVLQEVIVFDDNNEDQCDVGQQRRTNAGKVEEKRNNKAEDAATATTATSTTGQTRERDESERPWRVRTTTPDPTAHLLVLYCN
jgi:hypothetical protein